jgi:O-antigen ligase
MIVVLTIGASAFVVNQVIAHDARKQWWKNSVVTLSAGLVASMVVLYKFSSLVNGKLLPKSVLQARVFAWDFSWTGFLERPWFGWGQGVAWSNFLFRRLDLYWTVENVGHSHSAYFDVLLSGGILAGLLFCAYLVFALYRMRNLEHPQQTDVVRLCLIFFCLSAALFEPLLVTNYFLWPILVMALAPDKKVS